MASTTLRISISLQHGGSTSNRQEFNPGRITLPNCFVPRKPPSRAAVLTFARRRRDKDTPPSPVTSKKLNKKKTNSKDVEEDEKIDEDAFEALFRQLEEDLKNDELHGNDGGDDEISEEELAKLEQELAEALEDDELLSAFAALGGVTKNEEEDDDAEEDDGVDDNEDENEVDDDEEEEEEEWPTKLKSWQLKRLAYALKNGRRKTSIKNLAAELCLDRAVVLKLLRDPPPSLVMLSATLPDKPVSTILEPVEKPVETVVSETVTDASKPEAEVKVPVHVMQSNWSARKRLKKVQIETLEQVYKRTKRPTNAMVSSIVHVTNLPRKRVVKWFEDKRAEDGVPENRVPYQRSTPESVFTS